jgi:DNA-binding MarR family transcriptional regulator
MSRMDKNLPLADALVKLEESWGHLSRQLAQELKAEYTSLPPGHLLLLQLLDAYGPQRMTELAAMLGMSTSGATLLVDRAIAGNLVKRDRDPVDRRGVWVVIAEGGQELLEQVRKLRAKLLVSYLPELDAGHIEQLVALLGRISQAVTNSQLRG